MSEEEKAVKEENAATENAATEAAKVTIKKDNYQTSRTASGGKSLSNGDKVALALEGMTADEVYKVADNLIPGNDFRGKYAHLNIGMQRMNVGNRIRGFVNKRDKENEKIEAFNADRGEGVEGKGLLPAADVVFEAAVAPVREGVAVRLEEQNKLKAEKEAKAAEAKAEKEAKAKAEAAAEKESAEGEA